MDAQSYPNDVFGMDSSAWEDIAATPQVPDFQKARSKGARFNYLRASFGMSKDRSFDRDWKNCRATDMLIGAYHFLVWDISPERQAEFFWSIVKNDPGDLPLICDFEWWSTIPSNAFDLLYRFLERLKQLAGNRKIGIYTGYYFWLQYGKKDAYWKQYVLWLAHYDNTCPVGSEVPLPWTKVTFWQFTGHGDGALYGMESKDVDLDFFMGSYDELLSLCGKSNTDTNTDTGEETPVEVEDMQMKVIVYGLRIRNMPSTKGSVLGTKNMGDVITVYNVGGIDSSWVKISETEDQWCCVQNSSGTYLKKV